MIPKKSQVNFYGKRWYWRCIKTRTGGGHDISAAHCWKTTSSKQPYSRKPFKILKNVFNNTILELHYYLLLFKNGLLKKTLHQDKPKVTELAVVDLLKDTTAFFPETGKALKSSLRRIKTWLRSTMAESRLNGLAMMSVYRKIIIKDLEDFNNKIVEKFPRNPGSLYFN